MKSAQYLFVLMLLPLFSFWGLMGCQARTTLGPQTIQSLSQPVSFSDPNLETVIRSAIGKPTGTITSADLLPVTFLYAEGANITSVEGIQYAANLKEVDFYYNPFTDLSPLAKIASLTAITVGCNTNINNASLAPLSKMKQLKELYLHLTGITNLNFAKNLSNLEELDIEEDAISDLAPLAGLPHLEELNFNTNTSPASVRVTDLTPLAALTSLEEVHLTNQGITNLDALVQNADAGGLSSGDSVDVTGNSLDAQSLAADIPALQAKGIVVTGP